MLAQKNMYKNNMYKITFTKTHIYTKLLFKLLYKQTTNVQKQFLVQQTCFCTNILFRTNMFFVHTTFVWQTFVVQTTCCTKYFLCKNNVQDCFFVYKEITLFFWWPKLFKLHICIVCDCLALNVVLKSAIAEAVHKRLRTGFGALC